MNKEEDIYSRYEKLKEEFSTYQDFAENMIQILNDKNTKLEKKLDSLTNLIEISKYINSNVSDENLIPMINDMIIGILGVTYSSIFFIENSNANNLFIKASNIQEEFFLNEKNSIMKLFNYDKPILVNNEDTAIEASVYREDIHSLIVVPIFLNEVLKGYIVVEHTHYNFFNEDDKEFISAIANEIAITLENNYLYNKIKELSIKDPLLGIYNRRHFFKLVEDKLLKNKNNTFAIVMVDIDKFKLVNDTYGHQFGDVVLIETSNLLKNNIDVLDYIARYGGEEIVLFINNADNCLEVFNKINLLREKISENVIEHGEIKATITASFGISYYPEDGGTIQKVLEIADNMLYKAKYMGRNKVISSKCKIDF